VILRFCSEVVTSHGQQGIFNSKIAFVSTSSARKIYTCDFVATVYRLTYNDSISLFPSWSSDGKYLAYTSYKAESPISTSKPGRQERDRPGSINISPPGRGQTFSRDHVFSGDQGYLLTAAGKMIKS
jgi:TolB protein